MLAFHWAVCNMTGEGEASESKQPAELRAGSG